MDFNASSAGASTYAGNSAMKKMGSIRKSDRSDETPGGGIFIPISQII